MNVGDNLGTTKCGAALGPFYAEFDEQFGKANLDKIRNYK